MYGLRVHSLPVVAALLVASIAGIKLLILDLDALRQLHSQRSIASEVPQIGSLTGWRLGSESEWLYSRPNTVFFVISDQSRHGLDYWRKVASLAATAEPYTEFVGLCASRIACQSSYGEERSLILLTATDPFQSRSLAKAERQNRALLYFGTALQTSLDLNRQPEDIAAEVVKTIVDRQ